MTWSLTPSRMSISPFWGQLSVPYDQYAGHKEHPKGMRSKSAIKRPPLYFFVVVMRMLEFGLEYDGLSCAGSLQKFCGQYARLSWRVQLKVRLVVHGQNGSAVLTHEGHPFALSRGMRHVLNQAMSKIGQSKGAPFTRVKGQDRREGNEGKR